nr:uncharacterized protein LOC107442354 isoform X2 [Parasteatoda tepidariorum]
MNFLIELNAKMAPKHQQDVTYDGTTLGIKLEISSSQQKSEVFKDSSRNVSKIQEAYEINRMEGDLYNSTENYILTEIQKKMRKSDKYYEVLKDPLYSELCRIRNDREKLVMEQEALLKKLTDTEMPTKSEEVEEEGDFRKEMKNAEKSEKSKFVKTPEVLVLNGESYAEQALKSVDFPSDEVILDFMDVGMEIEVTSNEKKFAEKPEVFELTSRPNAEQSTKSKFAEKPEVFELTSQPNAEESTKLKFAEKPEVFELTSQPNAEESTKSKFAEKPEVFELTSQPNAEESTKSKFAEKPEVFELTSQPNAEESTKSKFAEKPEVVELTSQPNAEQSTKSVSKRQRKRKRADEKENDFESYFVSISERTKFHKRSCRK